MPDKVISLDEAMKLMDEINAREPIVAKPKTKEKVVDTIKAKVKKNKGLLNDSSARQMEQLEKEGY